jgi:hypothetical protein
VEDLRIGVVSGTFFIEVGLILSHYMGGPWTTTYNPGHFYFTFVFIGPILEEYVLQWLGSMIEGHVCSSQIIQISPK